MIFIEALFNNFWGYDAIIFLIGLANLMVLIITRKSLRDFGNALYYRPSDSSIRKKNEILLDEITQDDMDKIKAMRSKTNKWHTVFVNFITIFPLLGLLGTIISLVMVAGDGGFENAHDSFMMSLTSTFWGVTFAIIYKFADSFIASDIEQYTNDATRAVVTQED